jgi:hypothetical protein
VKTNKIKIRFEICNTKKWSWDKKKLHPMEMFSNPGMRKSGNKEVT